MSIAELFKFSFGNLWRRKLRTALTVLGVMIGTASIVVMMSLGIGLNYSYLKEMEKSSTLTRITISKNFTGAPDPNAPAITDLAVDGFKGIPHVKTASPVYSFSIIAQSGKYTGFLQVNAMSLDMLKAMKLPILEGSLPEAGEGFTLLAGQQVPFNFSNGQESGGGKYLGESAVSDVIIPDGEEAAPAKPPVDLINAPLFVVFDNAAYWAAQGGGGLAPKKYLVRTSALLGQPKAAEGAGGYSEYDYNCYADLDAVQALFTKIFKKAPWPDLPTDKNGKPIFPRTYNQAYIMVDSVDHVSEVQKELVAMGYSASSELENLQMVKKQYASIQYLLAGIGSVSLLVAAIGIANTMLMSIFERTKEIGIFKVLGCSMPNIRSMFLTESGLIGFTGGVAGLILSYILSFVINSVSSQQISVIPFWLALGGALFSILVGVISGLSPAMRAMKLSPLEAIRTL